MQQPPLRQKTLQATLCYREQYRMLRIRTKKRGQGSRSAKRRPRVQTEWSPIFSLRLVRFTASTPVSGSQFRPVTTRKDRHFRECFCSYWSKLRSHWLLSFIILGRQLFKLPADELVILGGHAKTFPELQRLRIGLIVNHAVIVLHDLADFVD